MAVQTCSFYYGTPCIQVEIIKNKSAKENNEVFNFDCRENRRIFHTADFQYFGRFPKY